MSLTGKITFSVLGTAVTGALLYALVPAGATRVKALQIGWPEGTPPAVALTCKLAQFRFDPECLPEAGDEDVDSEHEITSKFAEALERLPAGWQSPTVVALSCGNRSEGWPFLRPKPQACFEFITGTLRTVAMRAEYPRFALFTAWHPAAPTGCWCGSTCQYAAEPGKAAPPFTVLTPGTAGGAPGPMTGGTDCHRTPCGALAGDQPIHPACCVHECNGRSCGAGRCGGDCGSCAAGQECIGGTMGEQFCVPLRQVFNP